MNCCKGDTLFQVRIQPDVPFNEALVFDLHFGRSGTFFTSKFVLENFAQLLSNLSSNLFLGNDQSKDIVVYWRRYDYF